MPENNAEVNVLEHRIAKPDYEQEIIDIIRTEQSHETLHNRLDDYHESDLANVLEDLTPEERQKLYKSLDVPMLADVFEHIDDGQAREYMDALSPQAAAAVISVMEPDDAQEILANTPALKRTALFRLMDADSLYDVNMIASFSDDVIGSRMTTNFILLAKNLSVKEAMKELVRQAADNDNISTLFAVDETGCFYGALDLQKLIIARQDQSLDDLIATSFPYVYANENIDDCIEALKDYSEDAIPVLDDHNHILGVITASSLVEVVDDEMGEDYARLAGMTEEADLTESLSESIRKRMPWLIILLLLGLVVSSVVSAFEQVVAQLTIIVAFQSLILDMSGNVGTQSLAVTIRAITNEDLSAGKKLKLVWKEMRIGLCNGLILGILACVVVTFFLTLFKGRTVLIAGAISGCIGASLAVAMLVSCAVGVVVQLFF